jgi:hypothetical protein
LAEKVIFATFDDIDMENGSRRLAVKGVACPAA